jgi:hypothetical protein
VITEPKAKRFFLLSPANLSGRRAEVVLLGSIATPKYVEPLSSILGERLMFPDEFAGRGDMSRGALMLRAARDGVQLTYVPVTQLEGHSTPKVSKVKAAGKSRTIAVKRGVKIK